MNYGDSAYVNWIKQQHNMGLVEFWNHGLVHKRERVNGEWFSEFKNATYQKQFNNIKQSQELAHKKLGFAFQTFGAPYNQTDSNTIAALNQFPEINNWFYPHKNAENFSNKVCYKRIKPLNIEYPVHQPKFYHLWNNLYFHKTNDVITLQGHPLSWDNDRFEEFTKMIMYLKSQGYIFSTPSKLNLKK